MKKTTFALIGIILLFGGIVLFWHAGRIQLSSLSDCDKTNVTGILVLLGVVPATFGALALMKLFQNIKKELQNVGATPRVGP